MRVTSPPGLPLALDSVDQGLGGELGKRQMGGCCCLTPDPRGQEQVADGPVHMGVGTRQPRASPAPPLWGDGHHSEGFSSQGALGALAAGQDPPRLALASSWSL